MYFILKDWLTKFLYLVAPFHPKFLALLVHLPFKGLNSCSWVDHNVEKPGSNYDWYVVL
jgi:hypothetical protein